MEEGIKCMILFQTIRRKNREKNLFVNGRPFWVTAGRMSAEEKVM